MKKLIITFIVIALLVGIGYFAWQYFSNNNSNQISQNSYNTTRTLGNNNSVVNNSVEPKEIELYSFSTPIKSDSENRLTNIKITCSRINETIVESGKEFSFCDIVGKPSSDDGYKLADAYGADGEIIQAIGGGNCQVSTTIYNAALGTKGLKITERHEHDRDVAYVEDGKDATVAYDYLDLKFKNNNNYDIKLYSYVSNDKVIVKIFKIS